MSGHFKLVDARDGGYRIKLISSDGDLIAVSAMFPTKKDAVEGIAQLREIAGTGHIVDHSRRDNPRHERDRSADMLRSVDIPRMAEPETAETGTRANGQPNTYAS
jgi:uncharacterized protein YegP (UPF0339 family)